MKCLNCGKPEYAHLRGLCPALDVHVVIDADTLERVRATKHPRLLGAVLSGTTRGVMAGIEIEAIREVKL